MRYLLTGATGYLGKHVLARLLAAGHAVTVLVRPRRGRMHDRIVFALRDFEPAPASRALPAIEIIAADLLAPRCGIDDHGVASLRASGIDGFIHCAGLTRFDAHLAVEITRNNLDGTRHAHELCRAAGIARFHHVSTAFVAGTTARAFGRADLDVGQAFNNPYEQSKFAAEVLLHGLAAQAGPAIDIYRPSIIVGGHPMGEDQSVTTVYTFIKALHFLRECRLRAQSRGRTGPVARAPAANPPAMHLPLRIAAAQQTRLNLVAIEDVVDTLCNGLEAPPPQPIRTCHIVGRGMPLERLRGTICAALGVSGPQLVSANAFDSAPRTALEAHFQRITRTYAPYLNSSPDLLADPATVARDIDMGAITRAFVDQLGRSRALAAPAAIGGLALSVAGVREPRDYLRGLVEGDVGRHFLARHAYVDARVRFDISGEQAVDETLHICHGRATLVAPYTVAGSDCTYTLADELFMQIISGRTDLRRAFFAGKVAITGNQELALKFGALLGMYYHQIDRNIIEEVTA